MARKKSTKNRKSARSAGPLVTQARAGGLTGPYDAADDYRASDVVGYERSDLLLSVEGNVANHEKHIFNLFDAIEALTDYLGVDLVPAEDIMPRTALVAIERQEIGGEEENE